MGYLCFTGFRQEKEFVFSNQIGFGSIAETSAFASMMSPEVASTETLNHSSPRSIIARRTAQFSLFSTS